MNSLMLIRLRQKLQKAAGFTFPVVDFFAHPTIGGLARRLVQRQQAELRPAPDAAKLSATRADRLSRRDRRLALKRTEFHPSEAAE
jgi:hypothetical protein